MRVHGVDFVDFKKLAVRFFFRTFDGNIPKQKKVTLEKKEFWNRLIVPSQMSRQKTGHRINEVDSVDPHSSFTHEARGTTLQLITV